MDKIRRQVLEKYARDVKDYDLADSGIYVPKQSDIVNKALQARDLAEDSLGNEVLKSTGISIPGKGATKNQIENFLYDLRKEQYPDLPEPKIEISTNKNLEGFFDPKSGVIGLDEEMVRKNPAKAIGSLLHETGHELDVKMGHRGNPIDNKAFRSIKDKLNINTDPTDIYELVNDASKHHAKIPGREGSYGLSNLRNILKGKALRGLIPFAGTAAALSSGDVSAAIPGLDLAEPLGDATIPVTEEQMQLRSMNRDMRESGELDPVKFPLILKSLNKK